MTVKKREGTTVDQEQPIKVEIDWIPDMKPTFSTAEQFQTTLNTCAAKALNTGINELYAYGGVATENAIAVLMECAGLPLEATHKAKQEAAANA